jgi:transcriptional regulator with XRE-family HTH domain
LADDVGVARTTVSAWENDHFAPEGPNLERLADCLGVTMDWIVRGAEEPVDDAPTSLDAGPIWERGGTFDEALRILGHLRAELTRCSDRGDADPQVAFERVERRLLRLRAEGRLGAAGWAYWLAVREGARLYGGYEAVDTRE